MTLPSFQRQRPSKDTFVASQHDPRTTSHEPRTARSWTLDALSGRLVELSGSQSAARLSAAFGLVLEAQLCADRAAWVTLESSSFFPPDVADGGVDLEALPVVRVPDTRAAGRAADHLVRSGAFGLVVLDLSSESPPSGRDRPQPLTLPVPLLTRLLGLARAHDVAVLILTRKSSDAPSLNSLISLRAEAHSMCQSHAESEARQSHDVWITALKDKRDGPGWTHREACRGPVGVR